jgi:hypothetical protein
MSTDPFEPLMTFKPRIAGKRSEVDPHRVPLLRVALKRRLPALPKQKQPACEKRRGGIAGVAEPRAVPEQTKLGLAEAVRQSAVKAVKNAAGVAPAKWVSIGVGGGVIVGALLIVGWGEAAGGQGGRRERGDEGVRRSGGRVLVGDTPDGQLAFQLAKVGSLSDVARCSGRGMVPRDGRCTVQSERGGRWPDGPCRHPKQKAARLTHE